VSEFEQFPKIARLSRSCLITEKIDGTNAQIFIEEDGTVRAGSRTRWITPEDDNSGFAKWVHENRAVLSMVLGPGRHFGEWWGAGIQRKYGLTGDDKRFSLFNVDRWADVVLPCGCFTVPVLYRGVFTTDAVDAALEDLRTNGSHAAPGFMKPEGVVIWHEAARVGFKKTLERDEEWKGKRKDA